MIRIHRGVLSMAVALMAFVAACEITSANRAPVTEQSLIEELESSNEHVVTSAMQKLEKTYPTSTNAFPKMKILLKDERQSVRRKSARVLGALHADVNEENIDDMCALLDSADVAEIIDGLKGLRGLIAPSAVGRILPLLSHEHPNVVRDACRTLAVLGDEDLIPTIEPLLESPNPAIKADAQDAIFKLRSK